MAAMSGREGLGAVGGSRCGSGGRTTAAIAVGAAGSGRDGASVAGASLRAASEDSSDARKAFQCRRQWPVRLCSSAYEANASRAPPTPERPVKTAAGLARMVSTVRPVWRVVACVGLVAVRVGMWDVTGDW